MAKKGQSPSPLSYSPYSLHHCFLPEFFFSASASSSPLSGFRSTVRCNINDIMRLSLLQFIWYYNLLQLFRFFFTTSRNENCGAAQVVFGFSVGVFFWMPKCWWLMPFSSSEMKKKNENWSWRKLTNTSEHIYSLDERFKRQQQHINTNIFRLVIFLTDVKYSRMGTVVVGVVVAAAACRLSKSSFLFYFDVVHNHNNGRSACEHSYRTIN